MADNLVVPSAALAAEETEMISRDIFMSTEETTQYDTDAAAKRDMQSAAKSIANENEEPCRIFRANGDLADTIYPAAYARNRKDW